MKTRTNWMIRSFLTTALAASLAVPALAASKNKLDAKVRDLTDYFEKFQQDESKAVPTEILSKAQGLVIMRSYKAGFIIGVEGSGGVAIVKDKDTDKWGPIGFVKGGEGSFGFQAGAQRTDLILVLMNSGALKILTDPNFKIGADIRITAGPVSRGDQANLKVNETPILAYGDTKGLFGGAALQTGGVFPDAGANKDYYDRDLTMEEIIIERKVKPTEAAKRLADKIEQYAK